MITQKLFRISHPSNLTNFRTWMSV